MEKTQPLIIPTQPYIHIHQPLPHSTIHTHRLTPDRQSKKGALWSHKPLGADQMTATLKFRIHGQVGEDNGLLVFVGVL